MKKILFFSVVPALMIFSGCTVKTTPVANKIDGTKMEFQKLNEYKTGTSCIYEGPFRKHGSNTIADAARNGEVSKVEYAESSEKATFGSKESCTTVYGK